ncbi:MAG: helix-turn-helix transcriptional regulator [Deltaproteobacteria bacterium]
MSSKKGGGVLFWELICAVQGYGGLSQNQMARRLRVSPTTCGDWRRHGVMPDHKTVVRIAGVLGVPVGYFASIFVGEANEVSKIADGVVERFREILSVSDDVLIIVEDDRVCVDVGALQELRRNGRVSGDDLIYIFMGREGFNDGCLCGVRELQSGQRAAE